MIDTFSASVERPISSTESKALSTAHAVTITVAVVFQVLGVYASVVTFGAWITLALYAVGGLTVALQHVVARRRAASW